MPSCVSAMDGEAAGSEPKWLLQSSSTRPETPAMRVSSSDWKQHCALRERGGESYLLENDEKHVEKVGSRGQQRMNALHQRRNHFACQQRDPRDQRLCVTEKRRTAP